MKQMKMAFMLISGLMIISFCGCGNAPVSENEYRAVWQIYTSKEFEEGFFEKLSTEQRRKIFNDAIGRTKLDADSIIRYIRDNHSQTYRQIFE